MTRKKAHACTGIKIRTAVHVHAYFFVPKLSNYTIIFLFDDKLPRLRWSIDVCCSNEGRRVFLAIDISRIISCQSLAAKVPDMGLQRNRFYVKDLNARKLQIYVSEAFLFFGSHQPGRPF